MTETNEAAGLVNAHDEILFARIPRCVILDRTIPLAQKEIYYYLISRCSPDSPITPWVSQRIMMIDLNIKTKPRLSANIQALAARGLISIEKRDWKNIYTINKVDSIYGPKAKATWPKRADYVEALKKQDEISAAKENKRKANKIINQISGVR